MLHPISAIFEVSRGRRATHPKHPQERPCRTSACHPPHCHNECFNCQEVWQFDLQAQTHRATLSRVATTLSRVALPLTEASDATAEPISLKFASGSEFTDACGLRDLGQKMPDFFPRARESCRDSSLLVTFLLVTLLWHFSAAGVDIQQWAAMLLCSDQKTGQGAPEFRADLSVGSCMSLEALSDKEFGAFSCLFHGPYLAWKTCLFRAFSMTSAWLLRGPQSESLSGTGDSQRDSRESIRVDHSQLKPLFL